MCSRKLGGGGGSGGREDTHLVQALCLARTRKPRICWQVHCKNSGRKPTASGLWSSKCTPYKHRFGEHRIYFANGKRGETTFTKITSLLTRTILRRLSAIGRTQAQMYHNNLHLPRSNFKCSVNRSNKTQGFILKSTHNSTYYSSAFQKEVTERRNASGQDLLKNFGDLYVSA